MTEFPQWAEEWKKELANYPLYSEAYRDHLNGVITDHFLNREIGQETPDLFMHSFGRIMRRKMPLINKVYVATMREIDPLITTDMLTESESESTTTGENARTGNTRSTTADETESLAIGNTTNNTTDETESLAVGTSSSESTGRTTSAGTTTGTSDTDTTGTSETDSTGTAENVSTNKSRGVASNNPQMRLATNADYASSLADSTGSADSASESTEHVTGSTTGSTTGTTSSTTENDGTSTDESSGTSRDTVTGSTTGTAEGTSRDTVTGSATGTATGSTTETGTVESDTRDKASQRVKGYAGNPARLIAEYLDSLVNVDEMVIDVLEPCFMQVWNTSHEYSY